MLNFLKNMQCWFCQHISLDISMMSIRALDRTKDEEIARLRKILVEIYLTPVSITNPTATLWEIRRKAKDGVS